MSALQKVDSLPLLKPNVGIPTGVEVIDDFLLWKGIPKGEISIFQSQYSSNATALWRHMMDHLLKEKRKVFWLQSFNSSDLNVSTLRDLIKNAFFEVLAITLVDLEIFKNDIPKIIELAEKYNVSVVLICSPISKSYYSYFNLIVDCDFDFFTIRKALFRPTPFHIHSSSLNFSLGALTSDTPLQQLNPLHLWQHRKPDWMSQC
jgi:hypothetical protein